MDTRLYVHKKPGFQVEQESLEKDLKEAFSLDPTFHLEKYNIYDIFNADQNDIDLLAASVISEPAVDEVFENVDLDGHAALAYEYLPGQYDQRADSAMQCLMLLNNKQSVIIRSGTLLVFDHVSEDELSKIENYLINPVEARKKDLGQLKREESRTPDDVKVVEGFCDLDEEQLARMVDTLGLAMSLEDLAFIQNHFKNEEHRDPTITEIRVLDTYWSDHCRHTTFETVLDQVDFSASRFDEQLQKAWNHYLELRNASGKQNVPLTLMDLATTAGRYMRKHGMLDDQEVSNEINACSVEVEVDVNGVKEPWLLMFKNETHNHPTEIEPFGGASTCIGGAIRDPLSGRSYVYQAMRITGAGDVTAPLDQTLAHKLPQSRLSKTAAAGYSSYGNQIGLATTFVQELYHPGYVAKRMEVGAVVGAAPKSHVRRENPEAGDIILLLGGATGRDGIGGATGSSKEHNDSSLEECSSEVQKGNALVERKLQRLFRNPAATRLIKKSNDFGAGGVSVAVGELADGLDIDLDAVPVKYEGLDGTELAISESQERMAVLLEAKDKEAFMQLCKEENLPVVQVAVVSKEPRLVMYWRGKTIVDLPRAFLDTNGVRQHVTVRTLDSTDKFDPFTQDANRPLLDVLAEPNVASQLGLAEIFDASIGKSTVLMPFGGKNQLTPEEGSVQKMPVRGFTNTASLMTFGFDPELSDYSPWLGAQYSVVEALAKLAALGADPLKARLTNQEYFERLNKDEDKWGWPVQALLGLLEAQMEFGTPAIGGKDSMSGTFNDIHVPPTLITFAVVTENTSHITSAALKGANHPLYVLRHTPKEDGTPDYEGLKANFAALRKAQDARLILAAKTATQGGLEAVLAKMAFGNGIGANVTLKNPSGFDFGSILVEAAEEINDPAFEKIGQTTDEELLVINDQAIPMEDALAAWTKRYDKLYPHFANAKREEKIPALGAKADEMEYSKVQVDKPVVVIPVFPGQNCEYDCAMQFERAGAEVHTVVLNNLDVDSLKASMANLADEISKAQILMLVGGFSSGDEPDGSGKFIANALASEQIKKAIATMRANDGLILGICNGFQALVKSGLLPFDTLGEVHEEGATLFHNDINRHVSRMAATRTATTKSPWLQFFTPGQEFTVAVSHGEGKFMVSEEDLKTLADNGQIAFQYVDLQGNPTYDGRYNPNGSFYAIEGVISPDGRILGKMGHSERYEEGLFQNIDGNKNQPLFENGVRFFTHK